MMCAFMTPVLKNDWEIYKTKRSRNNSESSATSAPAHPHGRSSSHSSGSKRRGIGDTGRSHSYHAPHHNHGMLVGSPPKAYHLSTKTSRCASRTSMEPHSPGTTSPPISPLALHTTSCAPTQGPAKSPSSLSLTKFHNKVMDKLKNVLHVKDDRSQEEEHGDSRGQS
ncbi:hypothetical protein Pmani_003279 [Petrolisthes manimaculis]|uniref:Uncharacterized protein n=1 Tax=Petrolisthes manimaculis TaxID=1843537 RepID=A0AAE1QGY4_9EUCA|nr:hypothetical protein Pmani_003279 [Petrolisthes manimaculis]